MVLRRGKVLTILLTLILVAPALLLMPLGCGKKAEGEIKIGVILPLTGGLANFGATVRDGIRLAVADSEGSGESPRVRLLVEDSKGDPTSAVSAFNKLTTVDGVEIIIGDLTSSATLAMAPIADSKHVLMVSPTASAPALSHAGSYFYRVWTSDDFDGKVAAEFCRDDLGFDQAAVAYINNDYGLGLKDVFVSDFSVAGGKIVLTESFEVGENDFRSLLSKLKSSAPQVVYLPGHPQEIGSLLRQAKELGLNAQFVSNVAAEDREFLEVAGDASSGLYFTAPAFSIQSSDAGVVNFVETFERTYGYVPDVHAVKGHDAAMVILSALRKGARSTDEIRSYFDTTNEFVGIAGSFHFDKNGDVVVAASIKQYKKDGSVTTIKTVMPK